MGTYYITEKKSSQQYSQLYKMYMGFIFGVKVTLSIVKHRLALSRGSIVF